MPLDARLPIAEALWDLSWERRSEPTVAAGLARSCRSSVLDELEGAACHQSIPWRRWHPRHEPAPSSCHPPVPPSQARSTRQRPRTAAMFKIKLEPLKVTAWTLNVFVKFR